MFLHDTIWAHILQFIYGDLRFPLHIDTLAKFATTCHRLRDLVARRVPTLPLATRILNKLETSMGRVSNHAEYETLLLLSCNKQNNVWFSKSVPEAFYELWPTVKHVRLDQIEVTESEQCWLKANRHVDKILLSSCDFGDILPECWSHFKSIHVWWLDVNSINAFVAIMEQSQCDVFIKSNYDVEFLIAFYKRGGDLSRIRTRTQGTVNFLRNRQAKGVIIPDSWNGYVNLRHGVYRFEPPL